MPTVIWIGDDLMFAPMIGRAARDAGLTLRQVANTAKALEATQSAPSGDVVGWIVDLSTAGIHPSEVAATAKTCQPVPQTVAYGPHVATGPLRQAEQAGLGSVMSQGMFHRDVAQIVRRLAEGSLPGE